MNIRYIVELSEEQRTQLHELTGGGQARVRRVKRAQILLAAEHGHGDAAVASMVGVPCGTQLALIAFRAYSGTARSRSSPSVSTIETPYAGASVMSLSSTSIQPTSKPTASSETEAAMPPRQNNPRRVRRVSRHVVRSQAKALPDSSVWFRLPPGRRCGIKFAIVHEDRSSEACCQGLYQIQKHSLDIKVGCIVVSFQKLSESRFGTLRSNGAVSCGFTVKTCFFEDTEDQRVLEGDSSTTHHGKSPTYIT